MTVIVIGACTDEGTVPQTAEKWKEVDAWGIEGGLEQPPLYFQRKGIPASRYNTSFRDEL